MRQDEDLEDPSCGSEFTLLLRYGNGRTTQSVLYCIYPVVRYWAQVKHGDTTQGVRKCSIRWEGLKLGFPDSGVSSRCWKTYTEESGTGLGVQGPSMRSPGSRDPKLLDREWRRPTG